ncbi:MAG: hypothetical protein AAFQ18_09795 [Pseudomonadota bacterium]
MNPLTELTREDEAARERLSDANAAMVDRTCNWSAVNTGSWNTSGLKAFAPTLTDAFSALNADVVAVPARPFEVVTNR